VHQIYDLLLIFEFKNWRGSREGRGLRKGGEGREVGQRSGEGRKGRGGGEKKNAGRESEREA
jgi:hypothetical protein